MATRLLVVSQYWEPAQLAGGARSTGRAMRALAGSVDLYVLTGDRDVGDTEPWADLAPGWVRVDDDRVWYQRWDRRSGRRVRQAMVEVQPDVIYLPSLFAPGSLAVLWRRSVGLVRTPVIVAPEGELHDGALAHHRGRKRVVLALARVAGLGRRVRWRAADALEVDQVRARLGRRARVQIAPDLHDDIVVAPVRSGQKHPGRARVVFVSTIVPKKGLARALEILWPLRHQVSFDIYGPIVDHDEWARCRAILERCEAEVAWEAHGPIPHRDLAAVLADADLCMLATRGENYAYIIAEALEAGCPVLTSDQTPWLGLAVDGCGWDLALDPIEPWRQRVAEVVAWDEPMRAAAGVAALRRAAAARAVAAEGDDAWHDLLRWASDVGRPA